MRKMWIGGKREAREGGEEDDEAGEGVGGEGERKEWGTEQ